MKTIRILAFQGTGAKYAYLLDPHNDLLLYVGHLSYEFVADQPRAFYGFHPSQPVIRDEGGPRTIRHKFKRLESVWDSAHSFAKLGGKALPNCHSAKHRARSHNLALILDLAPSFAESSFWQQSLAESSVHIFNSYPEFRTFSIIPRIQQIPSMQLSQRCWQQANPRRMRGE